MQYNKKIVNAFIRKHIKVISKLKALDWFIILIISGIIIFLFASSLHKGRWVTIEFKVMNSPVYFPRSGDIPPYWMTEMIRPGDVQYDNLGQINLKVLSVTNWGFQDQETWVKASVKTKYNPKEKQYSYQYQPLNIGNPIDVNINGTAIHGIVTAIQGVSDERKKYTVTVKTKVSWGDATYDTGTSGIEQWLADGINTGDVMKDAAGNVQAEIIDKEVRPAQRIITTSDGRVLLGEDPIKKNVFLTIRISVIKYSDTYLFLENRPVKIGYSIPLFLENILITPTIIQILSST